MSTLRSIPATEAKTNFGEVLASIDKLGPVVVTRNGRGVAMIMPMQTKHEALLPDLARRYAAGQIIWPQIRDTYGIYFGDLLSELAAQGLQLPVQKNNAQIATARDRFVQLLGAL